MRSRKAVGVYLVRDGKVFLSQRGPKARHEQFKWESIGGEVESGETFEAAAVREASEEVGIDIKIVDVLSEYAKLADETGTLWHAKKFIAVTDDEPTIKEPEVSVGIGWFSPDEMSELDLASYAVPDIETLRQKLGK